MTTPAIPDEAVEAAARAIEECKDISPHSVGLARAALTAVGYARLVAIEDAARRVGRLLANEHTRAAMSIAPDTAGAALLAALDLHPLDGSGTQ